MVPAMPHPPPPPPEVMRRIRTRVQEAIDRRGIPLAKLARRAGVAPNTIRTLLRDTPGDVHLGTVCAVCAVLEVDVTTILHPLPDEGDPST